jgi:hypothetical protein
LVGWGFRFTYLAGQGYHHYIETTVFGYPVMKVNEWYLDNKACMELPVGVVENEPKIDQAAKDEAKIPWRNEPLAWQTFDGIEIPELASTTWLDEGKPWAEWKIEDVSYNVDVSEYIEAKDY